MQFARLELVGLDLLTRTRMPWGFNVELHKSYLQICWAYSNAEIYDPVGVRGFLQRLANFSTRSRDILTYRSAISCAPVRERASSSNERRPPSFKRAGADR